MLAGDAPDLSLLTALYGLPGSAAAKSSSLALSRDMRVGS